MEKKLIQEIKRIKELSNINEGSINENLLSDIKHFFEIASDKILETDTVKKLKEFFSEYISDLDTETSETSSVFNETTTDDDFYKEILDGINAPHTPENMKFLYAWRQAESTNARNNPFATTKKGFGGKSVKSSSVGVKNYKTPQDGIDATVATLKNGYYNCIVDGLKNNIGAANIAKCSSDLKTWGTGDLVAKVIKGGVPTPPKINNTTDMA
jgi:hypothetical protein